MAQSEQLAEFIDGEAGIADDSCHSNGINRIMPGDGNFANAVGHDDVFALSQDPEARLFQRPNCLEMINAGQLSHD